MEQKSSLAARAPILEIERKRQVARHSICAQAPQAVDKERL